MLDLVAPDTVLRHRALTRHQELLAAASEALRWSNSVWARTRDTSTPAPHLAAELDQARAEFRWHRAQTIFGPIDALLGTFRPDAAARLLYTPFLVLYLRWEADHPREWDAPGSSMWSRWTTKEVVLGWLYRHGVPEQVRPQVRDLIVSAVERPYRCKDWWYARLVRQVLDQTLVDRIAALRDAEDPFTRLRARYVLHVARDPQHTVNRTSWQRWVSADPGNAEPGLFTTGGW